MRAPYLVQRLNRKEKADLDKTGVDRHFKFDYMGSSEFEGGRLKEALGRMRETLSGLQILKIKPVVSGMKPVWFLGLPEFHEIAIEVLKDQIVGPRKIFLKEYTRMKDSLVEEETNFFTGKKPATLGSVFDGWWALDSAKSITFPHMHEDDRPWLIFRKKDDARQWLKDLQNGVTTVSVTS